MRRVALMALFITLTVVACLGETRPFTLAVGDDPWPSILTWDDEGTYEGLYQSFLEALSVRMGWETAIVRYPWQRAQSSVERGEADALIALASPERLEYAIACDTPVFSLYFTVYTYRDNPRLKEIAKADSVDAILRLGLTAVSNRGNGWHEANVAAKGVPTTYVNDDTTMLQFLAARRADIILDTPLSMAPRIRELGVSDRIVCTNVKIDETSLRLLIGKKSPYAAEFAAIDQAVRDTVRGKAYQELLKGLYGQ